MRSNLKISVNTHVSDGHIISAMINAIEADKIEKKYSKTRDFYSNEYIYNIRKYNAFNSSSILLTVAFLETKINEFFSDATLGIIKPENETEKILIGKIKKSWEANIPKTGKYSVFEKYSKCLEVGINKELLKGVLPTQNIILLTRIRNILTHHETESVTTIVENNERYSSTQTLEKQINKQFQLNPFVAIGNPFFPDKCLSAGCSCWGIMNALEFIILFFEILEMDRYIDKLLIGIHEYKKMIIEIQKTHKQDIFKYKLAYNRKMEETNPLS